MADQDEPTGDEPDRLRLDAVIFDLDGVITDTAAVHARAWKEVFDDVLRTMAERHGEPFVAFDIDHDYRQYVDGRPRYEGVAAFLASRAIELPWGDPSDPPETETVCGIGNRKNLVFQASLARDGVAAFPDAIRVLDRLAAHGIRTGLHTSSRNCREILRAAGLSDRFETIVDGNDLFELHLPGKPDPAPFREAAHRLGVAPIDAAVAEDATVGVRAGRRGGFGVVIGLARGDASPEALLEAGADVAVASFDDLPEDPIGWRRLGARPVRDLRDVPEATATAVLAQLSGRSPVVFCDFDGTLSEIVRDPDAATITETNRQALARLSRHCPVAVVSGRGASDVAARLGVEGLLVAGSHGFELFTPDGERRRHERAEVWIPRLTAAREDLQVTLEDIGGVFVEDKPFAIAVHYRNVDPAEHDFIRAAVAVQASRHRLASSAGKMVVELRPHVPWDKGAVVVDLMTRFAPDDDAAPVYVGDDLTDEDAFRVLRGWGAGIVVRGGEHRTAADFAVDSPAGVAALLHELADWLEAVAD